MILGLRSMHTFKKSVAYKGTMKVNLQLMQNQMLPVRDNTKINSHVNSDIRVSNIKQHIFSVAPMMEYTDRHQRTLMRLLSKESILYTEMVTSNALVRGDDPLRFLDADFSIEEPLVLQLGGSDPKQMHQASKIAHDYGYKQININCGYEIQFDFLKIISNITVLIFY